MIVFVLNCDIPITQHHFERKFIDFVLSSSEPKGVHGELIVYPSGRRPSVSVRHPPFSKIFSETAWPIRAKFYVEPLGKGERKFV